MKPYAIISDLHLHGWSAFSSTTADGENTRHLAICQAIREAVIALCKRGGDTLFIAGDIFHRRGEIAPNILNPSMDLFREIIGQGVKVYAIPGNHDLTANDSQRVGNSVTALESVGVIVAHEPMVVDLSDDHKVVLFPWYSSVKELIAQMGDMREDLVEDTIEHDAEPWLDAIIHAPIDGVLPHLPPHGLDAHALSGTGFNRVFSGHYHNHKDMGNGVYSVGALTHQTWGDINSLAGYLIVEGEEVTHYETSHPKFVDLTGDETEEEAAAKCKGNYVRVRGEFEKESELKEIRQGVVDLGALGVQVIPVKRITVTRGGGAATTTTGVSLEESIKAFLDKKSATPKAHTLAQDILSEARGK